MRRLVSARRGCILAKKLHSAQRRGFASAASTKNDRDRELLVSVADGTDGLVALVELNRPSRMNALSFAMGEALLDLDSRLPATARALVITGAGDKAYSTGRDLKDSKSHSPEDKLRYMRLARDTSLAMKNSKLPVVSAINGFCFGWGLEMALGCDLRVAAQDAVLCFPETSLGIFPGAMGTVFLPRIVGPSISRDLILTSRRFSGSEALNLGVVNRTASTPQEAVHEAISLALQIARNGPLGVSAARRVIDEGLDLTLTEHINLSDSFRLPLNDTADFKEALQAFEEKRKPDFLGK